MQLKCSYIILLFLVIVSCKSNDANREEIEVIGTIYKAMPKVIPPPPPKEGEVNSEIRNQNEFLKHRYGIFQEFISIKSTDNVSNMFHQHEYVSGELFKEFQIDSISMQLARSLGKLNDDTLVNKKQLNDYVKENLVYLNKPYPNKEEQRKHNINVVISFSKVAFDSEHRKAAVCVGLYYDKLSASQTIYILEKINNVWRIKFTGVGEIS